MDEPSLARSQWLRGATFLLVGMVLGLELAIVTMRVSPNVFTRSAQPATAQNVDNLETELAQAKAQLAEYDSGREQNWKATSELIESVLESDTSPTHDGGLTVGQVLERMRHRTKMAPGWAGLSESIFAYTSIATKGEKGIGTLYADIRDVSRTPGERSDLFEISKSMPSTHILDLMLSMPPELGLAINYQSERYIVDAARIVDSLPPAKAEPYLERLYTLANQKISRAPTTLDGWQLAAVLAFTHNYGPAKQFMEEEMWLNWSELALYAANWTANDASKAYVERMATSHPISDIREKAGRVLAEW